MFYLFSYLKRNHSIICSNFSLNFSNDEYNNQTIKTQAQNLRQMDLIKRIGTQKKKFKLQFFIGRLKFNTFYPGKIYIVIRRGNHKKKSQQKLSMSEDYKLNFNKEILELQVTLFFDEEQKKYQQKPGEINIVLLDKNENKALLGCVPFDVGEYANCGQQSIKQRKQILNMPKKLEGLIEFNVFIKYIGEGGSESSLDKISDFFFGKTKEPQSEQKNITKVDGPGALPPKLKQVGSDEDEENKLSKTEVKKKKLDDSHKTNYVTAGKQQNSGKQIDAPNLPMSKNFYFDEPQVNKGEKKRKRKDKARSNSMQKTKDPEQEMIDQGINGKMSNTNWQHKKHQTNQNEQEKLSKNYQKSIQQLQRLLDLQTQQKESYHSRLQQSQILIKKLQKELSQTKSENQSLKQDIKDYQEDIKEKDQIILEKQQKFSTKVQNNQDYLKELKKLQKQKNELIVENSKLKQKYKQDFKKYEQILSEKDEKNNDLSESGKFELLRMKEECLRYRETIQKVTKQKNEKASQLNRQRLQNKKLDEQMAGVKNALSQMKIKLCNKLNEAIVSNDEHLINLLMEINKDD